MYCIIRSFFRIILLFGKFLNYNFFKYFVYQLSVLLGTRNSKKIEFILTAITAFFTDYLDFFLYASKFDANLKKIIAVAFASENFIYQAFLETIKPIDTLKCRRSFPCSHGRINFPDTINFFCNLIEVYNDRFDGDCSSGGPNLQMGQKRSSALL